MKALGHDPWTARASAAALVLVMFLAPFSGTIPAAWFILRAGLLLVSAALLLVRSGPSTAAWTGRIDVAGTAGLVWLACEGLAAAGAAASFPAGSRVGDVALVVLAYLVAGAVRRLDAGRTPALLAALLAATIVPATWAILELLEVLPGDGTGRSSFPYANANELAGLFDLAIPLALALALLGRGPLRLLALLVAAALATALGSTFSRGAAIATATACAPLVVGWLGTVQGAKRVVRAVGAMALAALVIGLSVFLVASSPRLRGDLTIRLAETLQPDDSARMRTVVWRGAALLIVRHPFVGVGPGQVGNALVSTRPQGPQSNEERALQTSIGHAHNDILQVTTEAGVVAGVAFLTFWLAALRRCLADAPFRPWRYGAAAGVLAMLLHGLVDVNLSLVTGNAVLAAIALGLCATRARSPVRRGKPIDMTRI